MIYRVQRPFNQDDTPGDLIDYLSICNKKIGSAKFIYTALVLNKIVPDNWYAFNELSFLSGANFDWVISRKPILNVCGKIQLLYMRTIDTNRLASQKVRKTSEIFNYSLPGLRFVDFVHGAGPAPAPQRTAPINNDRIEYFAPHNGAARGAPMDIPEYIPEYIQGQEYSWTRISTPPNNDDEEDLRLLDEILAPPDEETPL